VSCWEKRIFQVLLAFVTLSGVVYLITRYAIENDDPFSVVNHPLEPIAFDVHVMLAPFLMFSAGVLMRSHAWEKFRSKKRARRRSGMTSAGLFMAMAASGYWLEVTSRPLLADTLRVLHIVFGVAFVGTYVGHLVSGFKRRESRLSAVAVTSRAFQGRLSIDESLAELGRRGK
jgi:hypothetical protein